MTTTQNCRPAQATFPDGNFRYICSCSLFETVEIVIDFCLHCSGCSTTTYLLHAHSHMYLLFAVTIVYVNLYNLCKLLCKQQATEITKFGLLKIQKSLRVCVFIITYVCVCVEKQYFPAT